MEWFFALVAKAIIGTVAKRVTEMALDQVRDRRLDPAQKLRLDRLLEERRQITRGRPVAHAGAQQPYTPGFTATGPSKVLLYPTVSGGAGIGSDAPRLVHDALGEVPHLAEYAVVSDAPAAVEAASARLGTRPAIVLRFEVHQGCLDVFAYLHALFPTTDSAPGFELKVARFGWWPQASRPHQGSLATWEYVNLAELGYPDDQIVATVVAWFLINCVQLYWQLNGDTGVDLLASFEPGATTRAAPADPAGPASDHSDRIASEAAELRRHGFAVQEWEAGFRTVHLVATRGAVEVGFLLDRDYPARAPVVVYGNRGENVHLTIDAASWSAGSRLLQIAEGLA
jgi:hypothetical protein